MQKTQQTIRINNSSWILLSILILGAALRILDLGTESFWFDEAGSVDLAMRDLGTLFFKFHNSPLYFLILKYWMRIWGSSEFALRSLSVIFGIGSIFLVYKIAKLLFDKKVGLFSAFLLSISPVHIFYSQETRNYSLLVFLSLLSMFIFIKLFREDRIKLYIYYALVNILLAYTLLHGMLVIVGQNLFFFLKGKQKKRWLITQAVVLIFFLLWFIPIVTVALREPWIKVSTSWIQRPHLGTLLETFRTFSYGGESYGGADFHICSKDIQISRNVFYIFGILFFLGLLFQASPQGKEIEYRRHSQAILLLSIWLFLSILMPFFFSIVFFPLYVIRCIIFALPAFLIFVALGISRIKIRTIQAGVLLIITILTAHVLNIYYTKELKINWKEALSYINANIKENDVIIVSLAKQVRVFGYYGKNGLRYRKMSRLNIDKSLGSTLVTGGFVYSGGENKLIGINDVEQLKQIIEGSGGFPTPHPEERSDEGSHEILQPFGLQDDPSGENKQKNSPRGQIINSREALKKDSNIWLVLTRWVVEIDSAEPIRRYIDSFYQNKQQRHYQGVSIHYYIPYKI